MKKVIFFSILAMSFSVPAFALLPPLYESINEYKALLNDSNLTHKLVSGELISSITRTEDGFEIITNKHRLNVKVIFDPQKMPGPAKFHLEFANPTPI